MRKGLLQNGSIAETILKSHLETHPPSTGDGDSVLSMLYESFVDANPMDDGRLKQDFNDLRSAGIKGTIPLPIISWR